MGANGFDDEENDGYTLALGGLKLVIRILLLVLVVVVVIFAGRRLYAIGYETFTVEPVAESEDDIEEITVNITSDMSVADIAEKLKEKGLIDESDISFIIQANVYGYSKTIKPGMYILNTGMTPEEMMEVMSAYEEAEEEE